MDTIRLIIAGLFCSMVQAQDWSPFPDSELALSSPFEEVEEPEVKKAHPDTYALTMYTASWCGYCTKMKNNEIPAIEKAGVKIHYVDVDRNPRTGITTLPTMELIKFDYDTRVWRKVRKKDGSGFARWVGYTEASKILREVTKVSQTKSTFKSQPKPPTKQYQKILETIENPQRKAIGAKYGVNVDTYWNPSCNCPMCQELRYAKTLPQFIQREKTVPVIVRGEEILPNQINSDPLLNAHQQRCPQETVDELLYHLNLGIDDHLVDYGCGDANILITAAKRYGCTGIGIEIDKDRYEEAIENVKKHGLQHRIHIIHGDVRDFDPDEYGVTACTVYLFEDLLREIRNNLDKVPKVASAFHDVPGVPLTRSESGNVYYR